MALEQDLQALRNSISGAIAPREQRVKDAQDRKRQAEEEKQRQAQAYQAQVSQQHASYLNVMSEIAVLERQVERLPFYSRAGFYMQLADKKRAAANTYPLGYALQKSKTPCMLSRWIGSWFDSMERERKSNREFSAKRAAEKAAERQWRIDNSREDFK